MNFVFILLQDSKGLPMITAAHQHLKKVDSKLGDIIEIISAPKIISTHSVFHDLLSCVVEQQIHYRSTKKTFQKLLDAAGLTLLTPDNFSQFEIKGLQGTNLAMKKYETIINVVEYWKANTMDWNKLSNEEVRTNLSAIKGIGKWTIDMVLIYTLERPNIFSYDDYHIKKIMTSLYGLNEKSRLKAQMKEIAAPWSPYQSTAFLYLLEWKKSMNKK